MVVALLASCAKNNPNNTTTPTKTKTTSTESRYLDDINDTFGFTTVGIVLDNGNCLPDFKRDSLNKEILNDAIYTRNITVQNKVKVKIKWYPVDDSSDEIQTAVLSNLTYYSVYMGESLSSFAGAINSGGLFLNLNDKTKNKYIDTDKPYWNSYIADTATVYDQLYCITGSPSLSLYNNSFAIYFSKSVLANIGRTQEDLFQMIEDGIDSTGGWTFDQLLAYIKNVGNGVDLFGLTMDNSHTIDPFWSGFDLTLLKHSNDGGLEFISDIAKFNNAIENVIKPLMNNNKNDVKVFNAREEGTQISPKGDEIADLFANNQSLFAILTLDDAHRENIRSMDKGNPDDGYGLIPFPKYDSYQTDYYSYIGDKYVVFAIPKNTTQKEAASATLEALASVSYADVIPKFYDTILKGQYMSDPYSAKMLDVITENIKIDSAWIFSFAFTGAASKIAQEGFREIINGYGKKSNFSTYWNSVRTAKETALSNPSNTGILDKYKLMAGK